MDGVASSGSSWPLIPDGGTREMAMVVGTSGFLLLRFSGEPGRAGRFLSEASESRLSFEGHGGRSEVCRESGAVKERRRAADTTHPQGSSGGVAPGCRRSGGCLDTTGLEALSFWLCDGHSGRVESRALVEPLTQHRWCFVVGQRG